MKNFYTNITIQIHKNQWFEKVFIYLVIRVGYGYPKESIVFTTNFPFLISPPLRSGRFVS